MRRARRELDAGGLSPGYSTDNHQVSPPPLPSSPPAEPLDWERIVGPSCCVCGEVHVPPQGEDEDTARGGGAGNGSGTGAGGSHRKHGSSGRRGAGDGARGGEESYVVLPDSTPVLSEDYFTLARNQNLRGAATASPSGTTSISHAGGGVQWAAGGSGRYAGGSHVSSGFPGGMGDNGATASSLPPGSELLESGFSVYGGTGGGFGGGWTGSGFGVGSSMLESIVQISHAGLSDNVRRESLLYELSKRYPRRSFAGGAVGSTSVTGAREAGDDVGLVPPSPPEGGGRPEGGEEEGDGDPTLCCHCYASLLEHIDEDSRLADREAMAYRDFVELLEVISEGDGLDSHSGPRNHISTAALPPAGTSGRKAREDSPVAAGSKTVPPVAGRAEGAYDAGAGQSQAGDTRKESIRDRPEASRGTDRPPSLSPGAAQQQEEHGQRDQEQGNKDGDEDATNSLQIAQALRMAQQTSVQLRAELRSLETQRGALCARGSEAWAALSELAYARGVLGDECRELLQVSREVAESATQLSERSALSDLFSIRHVDGFPSINGYRLGRAPDDKRRLHWNEINAAWGEAVLLVRCVCNAVDFRSTRFRLVPLNCASRVVELASGDDSGGLPRETVEQGHQRRGSGPSPSSSPPATSVVVVCAHELFSTGGGGRGGSADEKLRYLAAVRAFLACSAEAIAFVEKRVHERRLQGETSVGAACVAGGDARAPYRQTEDAVGGVSIGALKSSASWKAWLCQLVKNLDWAVGAASSLCVA
ncbi:unnamed protein product [Scytosiphon promiscuus]